MQEVTRVNRTDLSNCLDASIIVDRLDHKAQVDAEIDAFDRSGSKPHHGQAVAFARGVGRLMLFSESRTVTKRPQGIDPDAYQRGRDWLVAQDEALGSLIRQARALTAPPERACGLHQSTDDADTSGP